MNITHKFEYFCDNNKRLSLGALYSLRVCYQKAKTDALVHEIKIKLKSFKSSEHINEEGDEPYRGFGYFSLFSDPIDLATWSQRELL